MRPGAWRVLLQLLSIPALLVAVGLSMDPAPPGSDAGDGFAFAGGRAPRWPLGEADPALVASRSVAPGPGPFQVCVVGRFLDARRARAAAEQVAELLGASAAYYAAHPELRAQLLQRDGGVPLTPPEAKRLARYGVTGLEGGVGYAGSPGRAPEVVVQLGGLLIVSGLKGDPRARQPNPLRAYLRQLGGEAWSESDPAGPSRLAIDLRCRLSDARAAELVAGSLSAYLDGRDPSPPWRGAVGASWNEVWVGARGGSARADGRALELGGLELRRLAAGLTALLAYLQRAGAEEFHLEIVELPG